MAMLARGVAWRTRLLQNFKPKTPYMNGFLACKVKQVARSVFFTCRRTFRSVCAARGCSPTNSGLSNQQRHVEPAGRCGGRSAKREAPKRGEDTLSWGRLWRHGEAAALHQRVGRAVEASIYAVPEGTAGRRALPRSEVLPRPERLRERSTRHRPGVLDDGRLPQAPLGEEGLE